MENEIIIPNGWTYFAHRTNTERWSEDPFSLTGIKITKIMSVVTERDIYYELRNYGKNHYQAYNSGKGEPFEIRCLICDIPYIKTLDDSNELKQVMLKEYYYDKRNFGGVQGQRHHSIPPQEELVIIGFGEHDEVLDQDKKIIWTIPKRFIPFYKEEIMKSNNRIIELHQETKTK